MFFSRLVDVRPDEERRVLPMFALLALIIATSFILKPVRSAVFLSQFGSERLPYVYILVALVLGVAAAVFARWAPRANLPRLFTATALFFASSLVVFFLAVRSAWSYAGFAFYVWVSLFTALMPSMFWLLANYVFYANEGRRLFPVVMAGGLLGSILGGAATSLLVAVLGTPGLLLVASLLLVGVAALVRHTSRREKERMSERRMDLARQERSRAVADDSPFRIIARSRYLSLVTALVLFTAAVSTLVDYQFNSVVEESFATRDELTAFFGGFFAVINVAAFFLQLLLAGRLLGSFGVAAGLLVLPVALGAASVGFLAAPSLLTAALLKAADDGMNNSVNRASVEVLYLPVALAVKNRLKAWIDMFVERVSRGLAGLVILSGTTFLALGVSGLSVAVLALLVPWVLVVWSLRREYVETLKRSLARRDISDLETTLRDPASRSVFRQLLASDDARERLYALELLQGTEDAAILAEVQKLASHEAPWIRRAALRVLRRSPDPPELTDFAARVGDDDLGASAEALALWVRVEPSLGSDAFRALVDSRDVDRMAAVLDGLDEGERLLPESELERIVAEHAGSGSASARRLAAKALGLLPTSPEIQGRLVDLLMDEDVGVARAAATSAGEHRTPDTFRALVDALGRPPLRAHLRRALARFGGDAVESMERILGDERAPVEVRIALPRAIGEIEDQRSVDALLKRIPDENPRFHYQAIKGLARLRARGGALRFPRAEVDRVLRFEADALAELTESASAVSRRETSTGGHRLLVKVLEERMEFTRERIFRLLGLVYAQSEIAALWIRVVSGRPPVRAAAFEYLANLLSRKHRRWLLPLLEGRVASAEEPPFEVALGALVQSQDYWIAAGAVTVIGEERLGSLVPVLEAARNHRGAVVREAVARAIEKLSPAARVSS
jgi:AAA family ATP:ADP antiporter